MWIKWCFGWWSIIWSPHVWGPSPGHQWGGSSRWWYRQKPSCVVQYFSEGLRRVWSLVLLLCLLIMFFAVNSEVLLGTRLVKEQVYNWARNLSDHSLSMPALLFQWDYHNIKLIRSQEWQILCRRHADRSWLAIPTIKTPMCQTCKLTNFVPPWFNCQTDANQHKTWQALDPSHPCS